MFSEEIRKKFLEFFKERGHAVIPSASLVPEKDVTTLFTGSGMQPLLPYFLGEKHPAGKRVADSQKSFRVEDIDEVGDNRHTTFFEMLGNWSFGDYFKTEQLRWIFEFITGSPPGGIGLDPQKLYVTVFAGDKENDIPRDEESAGLWKKLFAEKGIEAKDVELLTVERGSELGMQGGRIFYYDSKKNWWSRAGAPEKMPPREPGGPDSEMFYEFASVEHDPQFGKYCHPNCDCGRFLEIGNSVFMEYKKREDGAFEKLSQRNVDFGGGLERMAAASNNEPDIFRIDLFSGIIWALDAFSPRKYGEDAATTRSFRIIADHMRAITFLIDGGVTPSNKDRGYVLRRLLRRAIMHANLLKLQKNFSLASLVESVIKSYVNAYPELSERADIVKQEVSSEENTFLATLARGSKYLTGLVLRTEDEITRRKIDRITGGHLFTAYTAYGYPLDLSFEHIEKVILPALKMEKLDADFYDKLRIVAEFEEEFKKHQEVSRAGAEKKFGGHGLVLNTGELKAGSEEDLKKVTRLHTATHLLQKALREILGPEVHQAGSDITVERTRFDFTFGRKLTPDEIKKVEDLVNAKIGEDLPMQKVILPKTEAEKTGALFFFKEKYPDPVSVYFVGRTIESAWSKEFCSGPHATRTGEVGRFRIVKEEAVGAGIRRIRAVVE